MRYEGFRFDDTALGMAPPDEGLVSVHPAGLELEDRLVVQLELPTLERAVERVGDVEVLHRLGS